MRNIGIVCWSFGGHSTLNYILALPQCLHNTKLTKFSLKCHPIILALKLRAAYDTLMAAMVVAGIVS